MPGADGEQPGAAPVGDEHLSEGDVESGGGSRPDDETSISDLADSQKLDPTTENIARENEIRLRASRKLSEVGRESRISEIRLSITRLINTQFRLLDKIQSSLSEEISLDSLIEKRKNVLEGANHISVTYNEFCELTDNKVPEQIKIMFDEYRTASKQFEEYANALIIEVEKQQIARIDEEINRTNKEQEEEERLFKEFMEERKRKSSLEPRSQHHEERIPEVRPPGPITEYVHSTISTSQTNQDQSLNPVVTPTSVSLDRSTKKKETFALDQISELNALSPESTPRLPDQESNKDLVELLSAAMRRNKKSVEPTVFHGDTLEFTDWEVDIDAYFEDEGIEGTRRLRHLKRFLSGDARKCVEGYFVTNTNDAYLAVRETLKNRYGNKQGISRSFRKKLADWPKIHPRNGQALREFSDFLGHLRSAMISNRSLRILNDCEENEKIVDKVPDWLRFKWASVIAKTQRNEDRYPSFYEFSLLVKEHADVMALPILQTKKEEVEKKVTKSYLMATAETKKGCAFCSKSHPTVDCFQLQAKPKEEKSNFMRENRLCFRCGETGHILRECSSRVQCRTCNRQHATIYHDPNRKPIQDRVADMQSHEFATSTDNTSTSPTGKAATPQLL